MTPGVVIVGGSVGGVRTARSLRSAGYAETIDIVEAEDHLPYDKPPLSKEGLGEGADPYVPLITRLEAEELRITLHLGRPAVALDTARSEVALSDGGTLAYRDLVIATGAAARRAPWGPIPGLHVIRTLDDATALRNELDRCRSLLVIGGGFIGSEVASVARSRGLAVTLVDPVPVPLARSLGPTIGQRFVDLQRRHGASVKFGVGVDRLESNADGLVAALSDGTTVTADVAVAGIGVELNVGWLTGSGLTVEDGVVADEYSRAIGHDNVHVVGDVARWHHGRHGRRVRVEHWTNAVEQADRVARNIARPTEADVYAPVEYVWSDQYHWKTQIIGRPDPEQEPLVVEQADPERLLALWSDAAGVVVGGLTVNWTKASLMVRRGIPAGISVTDLVASLQQAAATAAR